MIQDASLLLTIRAKDEAESVLRHLHSTLQETGGHFGRLGSFIGGVTGRAAELATIGAAGIAGFALESIHHTEEVGHAAYEMSEKFGLAKDQAAAWVEAGKQVGVGAEQMSTGFKFLAKNMEGLKLQNDAAQMRELAKESKSSDQATRDHARSQLALAEASKPLAEAFAQLGVSFQQSDGSLRDVNDVMRDAANAMSQMPDGAEKAGLAMKIFGRSGSDLIPLLNQSSAGIDELMRKAQEENAALSGPGVDAAQASYRAHKQLDMAISGLAITIGNAAMPGLATFTGFLTDKVVPVAREVADWVGPKLVTAWGAGVAFIKDPVIPVAKEMAQWFGDHILPTLKEVAHFIGDTLVPKLGDLVSSFRQNVLPTLENVGTFLVDHIIVPATHLAMAVIPPLIGAVKFLSDNFGAFTPILIGAGVAFVAFKTAMMITDVFNSVKLGVSALTAVIGGELTAAEAAGALGAEGLASTLSISLGPIGWAAIALGGLAVAAVWVASNWDDVTTSVKSWFDPAGAAIDRIKQLNDQADRRSLEHISKDADAFTKSLEHVNTQMGTGAKAIQKFWAMMNPVFGRELQDAWESLDDRAKGVMNTLADTGNAAAMGDFFHELQRNGHNTEAALKSLGATHNGVFKSMLEAVGDWRQVTLAANGDALAQYELLRKSFYETAKAQGMADDAAKTYAETQAHQAVPAANAAWNETAKLANSLGLTVDALQKLQRESPTALEQLLKQHDVAVTASVGWNILQAAAAGAARAISAAASAQVQSGVATVAGLVHHSTGGKFMSPHVAVVGDAAGGEWVVNAAQARGHEALLDAMVGVGPRPSAGGGGGGYGGSGSTTIEIPVHLDGKVIARSTVKLAGRMARLQGVPLASNSGG